MLKTLLSIVESPRQSERLIEAVVTIAEHHRAHLVFDVLTPAPMVTPALAPFGGLYTIPGELREMSREDAAALEAMVPPGVEHELLSEADDVVLLPGDVRRALPPADLILLGARGYWRVEWLRRHVTESLLLSAGTPLIVLPPGRPLRRIDHVVLGWKPAAAGMRALHAAIAVAAPSARFDIVHVGPELDDQPEVPLEPIAAMLGRHGFVAACHRPARTGPVAGTLVTFALDAGADLLAAGGYGHSRAREILLGGVTRALVDDCPLPVLLMH